MKRESNPSFSIFKPKAFAGRTFFFLFSARCQKRSSWDVLKKTPSLPSQYNLRIIDPNSKHMRTSLVSQCMFRFFSQWEYPIFGTQSNQMEITVIGRAISIFWRKRSPGDILSVIDYWYIGVCKKNRFIFSAKKILLTDCSGFLLLLLQLNHQCEYQFQTTWDFWMPYIFLKPIFFDLFPHWLF